jgi:hypothetical protein
MTRRSLTWTAALALGAMLLSGCAGPNPLTRTPGAYGVAGFWMGLWHGLICVITLVISIFDHHVRVYEVHNRGLLYDLGFVLGAMISLGGGGRGTRVR